MIRALVLTLPLLIGVSLLTSGCAGRKAKAEPPAAAQTARLQKVGTVSTVRDSLNFVLIDASEQLAPGQSLQTINPLSREETAKLTVSRQQAPPFFLGDILSGQPQAGDWVIRTGSAPAPAAPAAHETAGEPAPHEVQMGVVPNLPPLPPLPPLEADGVAPMLEPIPNLPPLEGGDAPDGDALPQE